MRPVSNSFLETLRGSHQASVQAFVVSPGQTGTSPTGTEISVISGDVVLSTDSIRATLDLTTDGEFPNNATDLFAPYGNEVFVRRGIAFGGGTFEWVSQGYFRIKSVEQEDAPNGILRITGQDRMAAIVESRLVSPVQYASTDTYGDVVDDLILEIFPSATIQWDDLSYTDALGRSVIAEEERYDFLDDLITSRGKIWYWDHRGILVIKNLPTQDNPVWEVNAGRNGVLVNLSRELSREGVYNGVVASGEALDDATPPRFVAVDDNEDSPTYWYGDFGKVPRFYSSPFITTTDQAEATATSLLRQKLGLPYSVDFSAIPNPALEPYDPVTIRVTNTPTVEPYTLVTDTFNRTVSNGWGSSDNGKAYGTGDPTDLSVSPGIATITEDTANFLKRVTVAAGTHTDVDGVLQVSVPNSPTGGGLGIGIYTRYKINDGLESYYMQFLNFNPDASMTLIHTKYVDNNFSFINSYDIPGVTFSALEKWNIRFRNYANVLRMRVWADGDPEPTDWMLETFDDSNVTGTMGVWTWRRSGNTNTGPQWYVHSFDTTTYIATQPGTETHVIDRITIPLTMQQAMTADTREQTLVIVGEV